MGTYSFDFAKTITTGEGGMILFQNESDYKKAAAWHDHGHENNPKVPRWEDTRKGSGFNYRMNELQGAVGIAQLKKLSKIISAQKYNLKKIWDSLSDIKGLILRESPKESFETADALIFRVENYSKALSCRNELLKENISTKILATLILLESWLPWYDTLIFMFQKEVADRIIAKTRTKEFSRLTVLSNWRLDIKKHFDISKNCFFPKPKVNSTLLSFKPKKNNLYNLKQPEKLEIVTRTLFSNRRKMINKSYNKLFGKDLPNITNLNIDLSKRPEELNVETFYKIAKQYEKLTS